MNKLSQIFRDLLFLLKGHYVVFNDKNARELIAATLGPHYLITHNLCLGYEFQCRIMFQLLTAVDPTRFQSEESMLRLIAAFSVSPEKGHEYLMGEITRLKVIDEQGNRIIDMGVPNRTAKERLIEAYPQYKKDEPVS